MKPERPMGVTILAILNLILSLFALFGGFFLMLVGGVVMPIPIAGAMMMGLASFEVIVGLVGLVVTYGLWTGKSWGWWLALILAILNILSILGGNIIAFIIGIIIVYYLTRPHVKAFFGIS